MRTALLTLIILTAPRVALACPVCFGQNDSPQAKAMNAGIVLMLGVVGGMMAGFAWFFISLVRRARLAEHARTQTESQEGTAQC